MPTPQHKVRHTLLAQHQGSVVVRKYNKSLRKSKEWGKIAEKGSPEGQTTSLTVFLTSLIERILGETEHMCLLDGRPPLVKREKPIDLGSEEAVKSQQNNE
jgi:hypothetical protein